MLIYTTNREIDNWLHGKIYYLTTHTTQIPNYTTARELRSNCNKDMYLTERYNLGGRSLVHLCYKWLTLNTYI